MTEAASTPSFSEFNPRVIPWQSRLIDDVFHNFDYSLGVHEVLLSGSVGSGKSLPAAHCALRHLLTYQKSRCVLARRAMPDLRDTIFAKVCEHLDGTVKDDGTVFREGKDFGIARQNCRIWFANGSEVISRSWADKRAKKMGSIEASCAIVEEFTENDEDDWNAIRFLRMRIGRLPHVPQNWIIYCANPDGPSHFAYDYFQIGQRQ
jgi:phage terminase large subunit